MLKLFYNSKRKQKIIPVLKETTEFYLVYKIYVCNLKTRNIMGKEMGQVTRYSESEQAWNKSEQNRITELQLARGFQVADIYLNRAYLDVFSAAPIISLNRSEMDISKLRLFEISKLVFDAEEKFTDKLMSVYSALHSMESSIAMLIDSDGEKSSFILELVLKKSCDCRRYFRVYIKRKFSRNCL